jgi:hypothetical protein
MGLDSRRSVIEARRNARAGIDRRGSGKRRNRKTGKHCAGKN